jgi:hypothetical protein
MTPEERRQIAFEVFDECLGDGLDVESAILRAADEGQLEPDIFRRIATGAFGDLAAHREQMLLRAKNAAERRQSKRAISEFAERDKVYKDFPEWFAQKTGRLPTQPEVEEMERLSWEVLLKKLTIDI